LPGGAIGLALGIALGVFHIRRFSSGDLAGKLLRTLGHMAYGRLVASIAGIALSAMIGSSRTMRSYLAPSLEFLRPLPVSAIIPVAIALLGLTQSMALFVIAFGAIWPMLLATIHGFAAVEPRLYEVAQSLHMSRPAVIFKIALPSASPDILSGMRLSLTVALILSVVCEILAGLDASAIGCCCRRGHSARRTCSPASSRSAASAI
jgi:sulfonate transport system permease protein